MQLQQLSFYIGRALVGAGIVAVLSAAVSAQPAAGNYTAPRTAWGDPDLQGKWPGTDMVGVPMQRDERLGLRNVRNDEEFAYVAAWEYGGDGKAPILNKEPLVFENVALSQRSYK